MRSATGGSLPALTSSVSCGASLKLRGNCAGSVMTSGPSSAPMRLLRLLLSEAALAVSLYASPCNRSTTRVMVSTHGHTRWFKGYPHCAICLPPQVVLCSVADVLCHAGSATITRQDRTIHAQVARGQKRPCRLSYGDHRGCGEASTGVTRHHAGLPGRKNPYYQGH